MLLQLAAFVLQLQLLLQTDTETHQTRERESQEAVHESFDRVRRGA